MVDPIERKPALATVPANVCASQMVYQRRPPGLSSQPVSPTLLTHAHSLPPGAAACPMTEHGRRLKRRWHLRH